tara:strand:- start:6742 stop:7836 length:1095 start_codon:yes stop_codon:yes gene_type:complete
MIIPDGFLLSGLHCGLKRKNLDLGLIYIYDFAKAIGFFTPNVNPSYSVTLSRKHINNQIRAVIVNSGNANCYSHKQGLKDTKEIVSALAKYLNIKSSDVLIASTGIIGKKLKKNNIIKNIPNLVKSLINEGDDFSQSLLTTDTFTKQAAVKIKLKVKTATISGFAKGAGMIYPNMATMLGFILTDVDLPKSLFKKIAKAALDESFNSISVDGCTSTNDTVFFLSSRKVSLKTKKDIDCFSLKLKDVCLKLAKLIVKDAEGASKFLEIEIKGAKTKLEAKKAGFSLANSSLFKCAIYGANANWGRIIASLGQAGIKVSEDISIKAGNLKKKNIKIAVDLKRGKSGATIYTSDLTPKYIKINAEYN